VGRPARIILPLMNASFEDVVKTMMQPIKKREEKKPVKKKKSDNKGKTGSLETRILRS
jgi:hypothetical protein